MHKQLLLLIFTFLIGSFAQRPGIPFHEAPFRNAEDKLTYIWPLMGHLNEPITTPKGINRSFVYKVPSDYMDVRFRNLDLVDRSEVASNVKEVEIKQIILPDLSIPLILGRRENFSLFLPKHRKMAARLIEIFMEMGDVEDFLSLSVFCRERINPYLFIYAMSVAILHRKDTRTLALPSPIETFPDKYLDGGIFSRARQEANIVPTGLRVPIEIPKDYSATDNEPEHRVAYFREDIGINSFHWIWHLLYPFEGPRNIVNKDRRGELFYYLHHQIVGRYNFERLCNKLARVKKLNNWHEPLDVAYFPKLDNVLGGKVWPSRHIFAKLQDINREEDQLSFDINDLRRWRDRIYDAIHRRAAINERGEMVDLTESAGIDILGNIIESSILSVNRDMYGDLHNLGHVVIAYCHDPDGRHLETFGVMADPATAMRDPLFYQWHASMNGIFHEHKMMLPRYTVNQLGFPGVVIHSVQLLSVNAPLNEFTTFWQKSNVDLSRGLDFTPRGAVYARYTHLQHDPYKFIIQVENSRHHQLGTVRIYLAPKLDERDLPFRFSNQRHLFIELDKFTVELRTGRTVIQRSSADSSVTIPFEQTFHNLNNTGEFNYCSCGWPDHMIIPKGNTNGFPTQLFVMLSNYDIDRVEQPPPDGCRDGHSYCGWHDRLYPDRRAMGFPFDRPPPLGVNTINEFVLPNMAVVDVKIRFHERMPLP